MTGDDDDDDEFLSTLYHALRTPRRRRVIELLADADEPELSVRHIAREIAAQEHGLPRRRATGEPYRNVCLSCLSPFQTIYIMDMLYSYREIRNRRLTLRRS